MSPSKELRNGHALSTAAPGRLTGYAAVFGAESFDLGGFKETIKPGAFTRSLKSGANIMALYHHDGKAILGSTQAGTLRLEEDQRGLKFEIDLPDTTTGRDLGELVKRGDISGCSFGFVLKEDRWMDQGTRRELLDVELVEITITPTPAYPDTEVAKRNCPSARTLQNLWLETL